MLLLSKKLLHFKTTCLARLLFISFLVLPSASLAQIEESERLFQAVPFSQWIKDGPKEGLPWRTRVFGPELSLHQRIMARFQVELDGSEILKRCCGGRAIALLEISDSRGQMFRNYAAQEIKERQSGLGQYVVTLSWDVFLLPGDYRVVMALYYAGREGHSLTLEKLHVNAIKNDPLPDAWRDLPAVEFCDPQPEGVDAFLLPRVEGHLNLPVSNRRPMHVELLENLTPYIVEQRTPRLYQTKLSIFLPILESLGQLNLSKGSLSVATMDFTRSRVTFEDKDIHNGHLDLAQLRDSLTANALTTVDVHEIRDPEHYGQFFGKEITQRLNDGSPANDSKADRPLRVLIILSGGMDLGSGHQAAAVQPPANSDFAVFYLRYELPPLVGPYRMRVIDPLQKEQSDDGIGKALKSLRPHVYSVNSAESVRKAIAAIMSELSRM